MLCTGEHKIVII